MEEPELKILIERCVRGDRHAQTRLYRLLVRDVYNMVIRMVPVRMDAEDIVQETFIRVFKGLDKFRADAQLLTWVKRIGINVALQHLRKDGRMELVEIGEVPQPASEPDRVEYDMKAVHEGIKMLPEGSRVIFSLYLLEGYRHGEIAEILGISESTSKSQYRRAKGLLRKILQDGSVRKANQRKEGCPG